MPFKCSEHNEIFLIEAVGIVRAEDVPTLHAAEDEFFGRHRAPARFLCDCTEMKIITPDGAEELVALMRKDNPRVEKSAFVAAQGTAALQLTRMFREVNGGDRRRLFQTRDDALQWLEQDD